jgi:uncharacterized protein with NAD-binding domain and iron-sulfur cluster
MPPKKVAILGGGVSAMTAAYYLTSYPGWKDDWDITVHQLGWRLGGKGASGRNKDRQERIEEHGLHIFLGFYENAFRTMRGLYDELGRRPDQPLARWTDAWKPHSFVCFMDEYPDGSGKWDAWPFTFPTNSSTPGDGKGDWPTPFDYLEMMIGWITEWIEKAGIGPFGALAQEDWQKLRDVMQRDLGELRGHVDAAAQGQSRAPNSADEHPPLVESLKDKIEEAVGEGVHAVADATGTVEAVLGHLAHEIAKALPDDAGLHAEADHLALRWLLDRLRRVVWKHVEPVLDEHANLRHAFIMVDLWASCGIGMICDGLIIPPVYWFKIDGLDFRAWIMNHGAAHMTAWSGPINSAYALAFGEETEIGAGTGMHGILRLIGGYKGAIFWEMQAGMGDTIFGPFYEVLSRRGVKFEFFHRVDKLDVANGRISKIHIGRPVTLKKPYEPLREVKGLPCWPNEPRYEYLVEGEELKQSGCDLEDWWTDWKDRQEPLVLEDGKDFDICILGTAIGTYKDIAADVLLARPDTMGQMVEKIATTQTQALQLWFGPDAAGLGWTGPTAIVGSYALWFDTWSDMTHLIPREDWPASLTPGNLAYLVSRLTDDEPMPPHKPDPAYTQRQLARVRANAFTWLHDHVKVLWPKACETNDPNQLNWAFLVDPSEQQGAKRFDAQYIRATVNPSERYVLSVPGSTSARLRAEDTGIANLLMCGDHTFTGINAGCVEGATMSGMNCAQALCGYPKEIAGDILPEKSK